MRQKKKPVDLEHCTKRDKGERERAKEARENADEEIKYRELGEISKAIK